MIFRAYRYLIFFIFMLYSSFLNTIFFVLFLYFCFSFYVSFLFFFFFFQAEDGTRDTSVTGVQTCALPILTSGRHGFIDRYYRLLDWLLAASVGILVVPVTIQIIARFTHLIPHWIWTEEMARFLFIWKIGRASCRERV